MKNFFIFFCLLFFSSLFSYSTANPDHDFIPALSFNATSTWCEYSLNTNLPNLENVKLALIKLITFRNKKPLRLKQIKLQWQGKTLQNIYASLYTKKEFSDVLIPIQQNLICDGQWNNESQEIIFSLDEKIVSIRKLYLVLHFPEHLETALKNGEFFLDKNDSFKLVGLD